MLPVLAFALVSALILKGQGAFEAFARHFLSAGFFYSNYQFLSEAGYFARASDTNLLAAYVVAVARMAVLPRHAACADGHASPWPGGHGRGPSGARRHLDDLCRGADRRGSGRPGLLQRAAALLGVCRRRAGRHVAPSPAAPAGRRGRAARPWAGRRPVGDLRVSRAGVSGARRGLGRGRHHPDPAAPGRHATLSDGCWTGARCNGSGCAPTRSTLSTGRYSSPSRPRT